MSEAATGAEVIPEFTVGDRLRKARELTGLDQAAFADEIGVSRQSVSNYELGNTHPRKIVLLAWSLRTRVPVEWLAGDNLISPSRHKRPHYQHQLDDSADTPPTTAEIKSFLKATPLTHGADRRIPRSAVAS